MWLLWLYDVFIIKISCWTWTRVPTSKNHRPLRKQKKNTDLEYNKTNYSLCQSKAVRKAGLFFRKYNC